MGMITFKSLAAARKRAEAFLAEEKARIEAENKKVTRKEQADPDEKKPKKRKKKEPEVDPFES